MAYILLLVLKFTVVLPSRGRCGESFCHLTATLVRKQTNVELWEALKFHNYILWKDVSMNETWWKSFESLWIRRYFMDSSVDLDVTFMTTMRGRMINKK